MLMVPCEVTECLCFRHEEIQNIVTIHRCAQNLWKSNRIYKRKSDINELVWYVMVYCHCMLLIEHVTDV